MFVMRSWLMRAAPGDFEVEVVGGGGEIGYGGRGWGGNRRQNDTGSEEENEDGDGQTTGSNAGDRNVNGTKAETPSATSVARPATRRYVAPGRCAVSAAERVIQQKSAPMPSQVLRAKMTRVSAMTTSLAAKNNLIPSAMLQESLSTSLIRGLLCACMADGGYFGNFLQWRVLPHYSFIYGYDSSPRS